MSDYIEVDWEVSYDSRSTTIDKSELLGCTTKEEMLEMILDIVREDSLQYIESIILNSKEVDEFIDEAMKERGDGNAK